MLANYKVRIEGTRPLMMNSLRGMDMNDDMAREKKQLGSKRKKTDEDQQRLMELSFLLGLYCDENGPYIEGNAIHACIKAGAVAAATRKGKDVDRAVQVLEYRTPLNFTGPKTPEKLLKKKCHVDVRQCGIADKKITVCRPIFPEWALDFTVSFDLTKFEPDEMETIIKAAGTYEGLGTYRKQFGRFNVISMEEA